MALPLLSIHLLRFLTYFLMRILDSHGLSSFSGTFLCQSGPTRSRHQLCAGFISCDNVMNLAAMETIAQSVVFLFWNHISW
jgi:hypothetical protein